MTKQDFNNAHNLTSATFTDKNTRKNVSKKEFATLKALAKTRTLGIVLDIDDTVNADAVNASIDYKLAHRGNAHDGTLISVWSRNAGTHATKKADYRDYGVRIHATTFERYSTLETFTTLVSEMQSQTFSHKNGYEVRYTFTNLADAIKFVFDLADAVASIETIETNESETKEVSESETDAV